MTIPRNLSFLAQGASASGVLGATYGGTGQSTITTGDLIYGSASNTLSKLAIGSTGNVLRVVAGIPAWGTDYTGTVTSVAATVPSFLSITGSPITSSGTLAITYSGTALPTANGGTALTSFTANGILYASSSSVLATSSALTFDGANFGIGIATASAKVDAVGTYRLQLRTDDAVPELRSTTANGGAFKELGFNGLDLRFNISNNEKMRLDASGNLGLSLTPSAWRSNTPAFQIAGSGISLFSDSGVAADLANNVYLNASSQYIYQRTDGSSRYQQYQGIHKWYTAPSGTAGTAATFTQAMQIANSGGVSIGNTTDPGATNLSVTGTVKTGGYTVAGLPTGVTGARAYVTNALAPSYGATVVGGGAVTIPVFYNGTNWIVA